MAHTKSATDHVCGSDLSPDESRVHVESIFKDDKDREVFLKTLGEACVSWGWKAHGFVLMGNHYHLLIETMRPTLVKGMQYLNSTYTARYNARHKTRGNWGSVCISLHFYGKFSPAYRMVNSA